MSIKKNNPNDKDINNYQKRGFIKNLPFWFKATFIKYWFYGAVYFFCFMGLGNYLANETLILVTGVIGGVFFDIGVYNIFLLFAETREEASKWWFFKSKKLYSLFINIAVIIAMFFAFYYIVTPIRYAIDSRTGGKTWLFAEPLSSALILIILDTAICWVKNLVIILVKKILNNNPETIKEKEEYLKTIEVTPSSITFEVKTKGKYNALKPYNALIDNEVVLKKVDKNVMSIYNLQPNVQYKICVNKQTRTFTTSKISKFYKVFEGNDIQSVIDNAEQYSLIIVNAGTYNIKSLIFKNNITIYFRKGVILIPSSNINDYPVLPLFYPKDSNEVYGINKGEASKIRQALFHLDHISNVKIIGEAIIDGRPILESYKIKEKDILPPNLVFINRSDNISIQGLEFKNHIECAIKVNFSYNINLINLSINNEINKEGDGIIFDCSSYSKVIGTSFNSLNNGISIKSCKPLIADRYHSPSKNINIRDCYFNNVNDGIKLGNENASGINNINIEYSSFNNIKNGIVISTNLNMGKEAIVKDINVEFIEINNSLTPIILNMYENCDNPNFILPNNEYPRFLNFTFKNITAIDYEVCAGYFLGLDKKYIEEIKVIDSSFLYKENSKENKPIELDNVVSCCKKGFICKNIKTLNLKNVKFNTDINKRCDCENIGEIIDK